MTHSPQPGQDVPQAPDRLRIAVVSPGDPRDRRTWSGSTYFIVKALEPLAHSLTWLGPLAVPNQRLKKRLAAIRRHVTGLRTYPERTVKASQYFGRRIDRRLGRGEFDLLLAPAASVEAAHIESDIPLVYISDATFALMQEVYPIFSSMGKAAVTEHRFEQAVIDRADLLVYPSHWAARSAMHSYAADPDKVRVIPFGANLDTSPVREACLGRHIKDRLELLFLAKEWERKGGEIAFHTLLDLLEHGVDARLTVCGTVPPAPFRHERMTVIPYLNKNIPEQRARFEEVLSRSHLLLLPTRAECYGVVFCEAAAYGLPVYATDVGGVGTIVENGVNGHLLPPAAGGADFSRLIRETALDPSTYMRLNTESRRRYEERLNWEVWGHTMTTEISRILPKP